MGQLSEKVSYLRGMADGMEISSETREGKLMLQILETLAEFAIECERMDDVQEELSNYVDCLDDDMSQIMAKIEEPKNQNDPSPLREEPVDDDDDDDGYVQLTCPHCEKDIIFTMDEFDGEDDPSCPHCKKSLFSEEK